MVDRSNWPTKKLTREEAEEAETDVTTSPQERWAMMWELAVNAWAFKNEPVDERLSRHVVRIVRRER